jgi:hypothetical protein
VVRFVLRPQIYPAFVESNMEAPNNNEMVAQSGALEQEQETNEPHRILRSMPFQPSRSSLPHSL